MKKFIIGLMLVSTPAIAQDRIAQYDFDKDGKVSFEDINRYCSVSSNLFEKADKNGDGALSNTEMRTGKGYLFARCTEEKKDA
jgi:Ca2+-binding EF-hand superfamily protein